MKRIKNYEKSFFYTWLVFTLKHNNMLVLLVDRSLKMANLYYEKIKTCENKEMKKVKIKRKENLAEKTFIIARNIKIFRYI